MRTFRDIFSTAIKKYKVFRLKKKLSTKVYVRFGDLS
jgi:hypothetical protein